MTRLVLDTYLPYRLSVASNKVSGLIARAYEKRFGLTIPQWRIMVTLAGGVSLSQKGLVERTAMDKVTISRAVGVLVNRGYLIKSENLPDKRSDLLSLCETGHEVVEAVSPLAQSIEAALKGAIGQENAIFLDKMLRELEAQVDLLSGVNGN